jgi:hypothetical protein
MLRRQTFPQGDRQVQHRFVIHGFESSAHAR